MPPATATPLIAEDQTGHAAAHRLVQDLHSPSPAIFWTDMLASAVVGWVALLGALWLPLFSPLMLGAASIAVFAFYRGLCFIHEISHLNPRHLPGFDTVWNVLLGVPLLLPSFIYTGVHQWHHKLSTFGTKEDPEYLPFAQSHRVTIQFALGSLLIPFFLLFRFLVLSLAGLMVPRLHRWLEVHASALSMNLAFERRLTEAQARQIRRWEAVILVQWAVFAGAAYAAGVFWQALGLWYAVTAVASLINSLRTLGAHRYESEGEPLDRAGQLHDSLDTPGALWTELWAPVGLRYHALHHYFPGIPYHNLGTAYQRLVSALPANAAYRASTSPSLWHSLRALYDKGQLAVARKRGA